MSCAGVPAAWPDITLKMIAPWLLGACGDVSVMVMVTPAPEESDPADGEMPMSRGLRWC